MESLLCKIVADIAQIDVLGISVESRLSDNGIDSFNKLILREKIERHFNIIISDNTIVNILTIRDLVDYLVIEQNIDITDKNIDCTNNKKNSDNENNKSLISDKMQTKVKNGLIISSMEIGMPLTGRNNLAEGPFLQYLGDLRWTHMCSIAGVKSKNVTDDSGNRLYPTFFYVEIAFPKNYPMASYGENYKFNILGDLKRFGTSMLDGNFYLFPENVEVDENIVLLPHEDVLKSGVAIVRLSNIFVMQFNGAEWLKKSRPANVGFTSIPQTFEPFTSYGWVKTVQEEGCNINIPHGHIPITDTPAVFEYQLVPDRDLNGAGLVYFAHYPVFLDICERKLLESSNIYLFEDDLIDRRTLVNRRSAYLNNASSKDTLRVEISAFIENPFISDHKYPELAPISLFFKYQMFRNSDNRLMMISVAEKTIFGRTAEDLSFYNDLSK